MYVNMHMCNRQQMFLLEGEMTSSVIVKELLLVRQVWSWEPSQLLRATVPPC